MISKFKVGDRVVIQDSGDKYYYTTDGSRGVVVDLNVKCSVYVKFDVFTGGHSDTRGSDTFPIDPEFLVLDDVYDTPLYNALK